MAQKTVTFSLEGAGELPNTKPVMHRTQTASGVINYVGVAKRGRVRDRINEHLDEGVIPGSKVIVVQLSSIGDAKAKEARIISQMKPKYNKRGK